MINLVYNLIFFVTIRFFFDLKKNGFLVFVNWPNLKPHDVGVNVLSIYHLPVCILKNKNELSLCTVVNLLDLFNIN